MHIIFFGSDPWFSPPVLKALLKAGHEVPIVITKGDAIGKGRRMKDEGRRKIQIIQAKRPNDISVNSLMSAFGLQLLESEPRSRRPSAFSLARPDAIVLAAFGPPFLPAEILNWPKYGCLNVHASLLPRWRGASPVFGAIVNGDKETGVSIMRMTEKVDRGPILGQVKTLIESDLTRETLTKKLGILGSKLIVETLKKLENGQINAVKQPSKSPTFYTHRLTKDSGRINWDLRPGETSSERSRRIERFIRAVTPWPGAWTEYRDEGRRTKDEGRRLKIFQAHLEFPPTPLSQHPNQQLTTNNQQLVIDFVQLPGKNPISWKQFLAGHPNTKLE